MSERLYSVTSVFSDFDSDYDFNVNRNAGDDENDDGFEHDGAGVSGSASSALQKQLSIVQEATHRVSYLQRSLLLCPVVDSLTHLAYALLPSS